MRDRVDAPGSSGFEPGTRCISTLNRWLWRPLMETRSLWRLAERTEALCCPTPAGRPVAKLSPQAGNHDPASTSEHGAYQYGMIQSLRTEPDLVPLAWPKTVGSSAGEWMDRFYWRNYRA